MNALFLLIIAYLCGSIPTGYWVVKGLKGIDLLQVGSGSTGTTNVLRTAGKGAAAFVFFFDIAKGSLPVWLSIYAVTHGMISDIPLSVAAWLPLVVALVAIVGHSKSIFLNFKGGKSAATGLGCMAAMDFRAALCAFAVFASMVYLFRYVSLASITAVTCSAFLMAYFAPPTETLHVAYITFCAVGAGYVTFRHKDNIKRLLAGTEPKIGQKVQLPPPGGSAPPSTAAAGDDRVEPTEPANNG